MKISKSFALLSAFAVIGFSLPATSLAADICSLGERQSPIDLPAASVANLSHLGFHYDETALEVENTGSTIEVPIEPGSFLKIGKESYELIQFHFHTPSEHRVQGEELPMELHFVHRNALGELAVVGVFMKEGRHNDFIQKIWDHMPAHAGTADVHTDINAVRLLPRERDFFRYAGSLTTPPCSEGVKWSVMSQPIEVSAAQIAQFRAVFPLNARPVQPLNDRPISTNND